MGKYVEALLQENDCVVLPSFGAFIAHTNAASYVNDEHTFLPPTRSLGFQRELTSDDGLLTSYLMLKGGIGFSEARAVVDRYVDRLRDTLGVDGAVKLPGVGRLRQDIRGNITFEPATVSVTAPALFGLEALAIRDLTALDAAEQRTSAETVRPTKIITTTPRTIDIHVGRRALRYIASVAAVLLLLIVFALPVNDGKYTDVASLGLTPVIDTPTEMPALATSAVEAPDIATHLAEAPAAELPVVETPATEVLATEVPAAEALSTEVPAVEVSIAPVAPIVPTTSAESPDPAESPAPAEAPAPAPRPTRIYHAIVGSFPSLKGTDAVVQKYVDRGFGQTTTVVGDDHVRISIASFTDKAEGEAFVRTLRQQEDYKHVWLLSVRAR
ncbi:MAG: hypothetical protein IKS80_04555 [Bacteroidaceae bacterium]|nr:hypothetical protein [Bacteroidaceae bacterium]